MLLLYHSFQTLYLSYHNLNGRHDSSNDDGDIEANIKETIVETNRFYFTKIDFILKLFVQNGMERCIFKIYIFGVVFFFKDEHIFNTLCTDLHHVCPQLNLN